MFFLLYLGSLIKRLYKEKHNKLNSISIYLNLLNLNVGLIIKYHKREYII